MYYGPGGEVIDVAAQAAEAAVASAAAAAGGAGAEAEVDVYSTGVVAQEWKEPEAGGGAENADAAASAPADAAASAAAAAEPALEEVGTRGLELGSAMTAQQAVAYAAYLARRAARAEWPDDEAGRARMRDWAARAVQRVARGHLGRLRAAARADPFYVPRLDESGSGHHYYVDLRTGLSSWTLPRHLPASLCSFKVLCARCGGRLSALHCLECDEAFCAACFGEAHSGAEAADADARARFETHTTVGVTVGESEACIQCEARLATFGCALCAAAYCARCWGPVHEADGRAHHEGELLAAATHRADGSDISKPRPTRASARAEAAAAKAAELAKREAAVAAKKARLAEERERRAERVAQGLNPDRTAEEDRLEAEMEERLATSDRVWQKMVPNDLGGLTWYWNTRT